MGPTIIFDKSFLQSLSIDESVFLQQFFISNITPLFYVETLGDLGLGQHQSGKPITKVISELSIKVPSTSSAPNVHHKRLLVGNLYGIEVEMDGRTIRDGGVEKIDHEGKVGIHYSESEEDKALRRWRKQEYLEIEKEFSKEWRISLSNLSFDYYLGIIKNIVPQSTKLSDTKQVFDFVENFVRTTNVDLMIYLVCEFNNLPQKVFQKTSQRLKNSGATNFDEFAPYAAFITKIDLFFYICMLKGFESQGRPSHKIDLAYLYYLPFCNVFTSNDKLHKRVAPFFLRDDQLFVDGQEFKNGLSPLDSYYEKYSDKIIEKGFMGFVNQPPKGIDNSISAIWDKIFPDWRNSESEFAKERDQKEDQALIDHLKKVEKESVETKRITPTDKVEHISVKHNVPVQKGKWRILPKGIENKHNH